MSLPRLAAVLAVQILLPTPGSPAWSHPMTAPKGRRTVLPLSVEVLDRTDVFASPGKRGPYVGTLARGARMPILASAKGGRCRGGIWLAISREAWMCADHGSLRWAFPRATPQPILGRGQLVPRSAYYTRRDGVPVFLTREDAQAGRHDRLVERGFSFSRLYGLRVGDRRFIRTRKGEIIPMEELYLYQPSAFQGRALVGAPSGQLACSIGYKRSPIRSQPSGGARRTGYLPHHAWVTVHETVGQRKERFHRIAPEQWVRSDALRVFHFTSPPPGLKAGERWVEILLRNQTLVAYEGSRPVYATLVSTGRWEHRTPRGVYRARTKVAISTMANRLGAGELYRVDDVPWILYFKDGYALHGTYWHDSFGVPKSHGCINLSPRDARWLFGWAPPNLPPGWEAFESRADSPGLLIRIRDHREARVEYRGPEDQRPMSVVVAAP